MRTLYHVTTKHNWERIKLKGLEPRIGYLAGPILDFIRMAETKPAVYLFTEILDGMGVWWSGESGFTGGKISEENLKT